MSAKERISIMTISNRPQPAAPTAQHPEFSLERISRLVSDLEQELAKAPADLPNIQELREEIDTLKGVLATSDSDDRRIEERLHSLRGGLQDVTARVEGEVLMDSRYIAELGRILGLV
jgi:hypothetical protein